MVVLLGLRGIPSGSAHVADGRASFSLMVSSVSLRAGPPQSGHPAVRPLGCSRIRATVGSASGSVGPQSSPISVLVVFG